jgi:hypothetical protein
MYPCRLDDVEELGDDGGDAPEVPRPRLPLRLHLIPLRHDVRPAHPINLDTKSCTTFYELYDKNILTGGRGGRSDQPWGQRHSSPLPPPNAIKASTQEMCKGEKRPWLDNNQT